jgi:hypothetical protein
MNKTLNTTTEAVGLREAEEHHAAASPPPSTPASPLSPLPLIFSHARAAAVEANQQ